ncbi:hypothetical protein JMUB3935_0407 [Leptotrichia trevisanii]|uniref:Uncharacterized protein n=1 Tax=Leptotrichia trevisanii TaxID=109328 RepID=A0A510KID2_9FUSO|nr:hypothetical protein [Leptotrichia trevisanii]BBM51440.1 hypothetical protein JMUB3935_0407 [Leptotrichia trevisanii]
MPNEIETIKNYPLSEKMTKFENILLNTGLPYENIIASIEERESIMNQLPILVDKIPLEQKREAVYLSRFYAAAAIGLFDASLNYIWNEVIIRLREKIEYYGLDTFFDNAVNTKVREHYKSKEDLSGIKDRVLLDTCKKLELLSDIVYRKLCHILDMRNQIGASHPNSYDINHYELLGWLKTCVTEVINDKPSKSAIKSKEIIENIKTHNEPLDDITLASFEKAVKNLSSSMASNLLTSLFGLYIKNTTNNDIRNNILEISKLIWKYCKIETKYDIGEKETLYRNNLDEEKRNLTHTFLEKCDGLSFLNITDKGLQLSNLCDNLNSIHSSWNNYYNEPPCAREIMKYIKISDDIPEDREQKLIRTILTCRIGNEVSFGTGVSEGAVPYYNSFLKLLSKKQIILLLEILPDILNSISKDNGTKSKNVKEILELIKSPILGDRINEILDYMLNFPTLSKVYNDNKFKDLCKYIINYND